MSAMLSPQGMALATAMAVSAGTVIVLAFCLQRIEHHPISPRSCISNNDEKRRQSKKKKKRVHFAEDVVEPRGDGEEFRRQWKMRNRVAALTCKNSSYSRSLSPPSKNTSKAGGFMPANRAALYNGILRDRLLHRFADYSY